MVLITGLILAHGLWRSHFTVDGTTLGLLGVLVVVVLVPMLESATLPGGTGLRFKLSRLQSDTEALEETPSAPVKSVPAPVDSPQGESVIAPATAAVAEAAAEGAEVVTDDGANVGPEQVVASESEPPPALSRSAGEIEAEVLREASRSPRVGLMVLSAELERAARQVFLSTGLGLGEPVRSPRRSVEQLVAIGGNAASLGDTLKLFYSIRNQIVHGAGAVPDNEVLRAIDAGLGLLRVVLATPRDRHIVEYFGLKLYSDPELPLTLQGVGLIVETFVADGGPNVRRVFPTTRTYYKTGMEVTWEWSSTNTWPSAWYRDPADGQTKFAWSSSEEFVGRDLKSLL